MPVIKDKPLPDGHPLKRALVVPAKVAKGHRYSIPEASPDDPIYKRGFAVGVTRSTNSSQNTAEATSNSLSNLQASTSSQMVPEEAAANAYEQAISLLQQDMIDRGEANLVSTYRVLRIQKSKRECEKALAKYNEQDPMAPASQAIEDQIRQWGGEATDQEQPSTGDTPFIPVSAQDEQNEILETAYNKKIHANKSFAKQAEQTPRKTSSTESS